MDMPNNKLFAALRLAADIGEDTAVHIQDMSVDEIGRIAGKKHSGADQVFRIAPAVRRGSLRG